jgi:hypothetical protein
MLEKHSFSRHCDKFLLKALRLLIKIEYLNHILLFSYKYTKKQHVCK